METGIFSETLLSFYTIIYPKKQGLSIIINFMDIYIYHIDV